MTSLFLLLAILVVLALIIGYYASSIFKGARPHGLNGDLIAAVITVIVVGLMDWYIIPMILPGMSPLLVFISSLIEPVVSAFIVLWVMRYLKRR
ncbi:MAG TPA: hypothetical protein G4N96_11820 [Chloroflexi bacterium]|nr:hypothetical protein [Chloroflexota bacterium]